jgi:hypothetical protein
MMNLNPEGHITSMHSQHGILGRTAAFASKTEDPPFPPKNKTCVEMAGRRTFRMHIVFQPAVQQTKNLKSLNLVLLLC